MTAQGPRKADTYRWHRRLMLKLNGMSQFKRARGPGSPGLTAKQKAWLNKDQGVHGQKPPSAYRPLERVALRAAAQ